MNIQLGIKVILVFTFTSWSILGIASERCVVGTIVSTNPKHSVCSFRDGKTTKALKVGNKTRFGKLTAIDRKGCSFETYRMTRCISVNSIENNAVFYEEFFPSKESKHYITSSSGTRYQYTQVRQFCPNNNMVTYDNYTEVWRNEAYEIFTTDYVGQNCQAMFDILGGSRLYSAAEIENDEVTF